MKHYSLRTEQTYVQRIRRFILFHDKRHPEELGAPEVEAFLTNLATEGKFSASTQTQPREGRIRVLPFSPHEGRYIAGFHSATHTRPPRRRRCRNRSRPCG